MAKMRGNPWAMLVSLCVGMFMILLDVQIVNIAIPAIVAGLHATLDQVLWVVNAYVLVFVVLLVTAGRLGDLAGPKNLFLAGLGLFVAASAVCGLAQDPTQLIAARAAQGVGGALLTPQTLALITAVFPPERRGAAFGVWGAVVGVAGVAGPTVGGLIVSTWGWRWIFAVNVPVGAAALLAGVLLIPDLRPGRRHRLDLLGVLLATVGMTAIVFGLIEGQRYEWGVVAAGVTIPEIIGLGVLLTAAFLVEQVLRRDREPLVPFDIFRDRNYRLMTVVGFGLWVSMLGFLLPLNIYLQSVLGMSALEAGLTLAPMPLAALVMGPVSGRLTDRIGGKYVLLAGLTLYAAGIALLDSLAGVSTSRTTLVLCLALAGLGAGCCFAPLNTMAMGGIPPRLAGAAAGMLNTTQRLGLLIGNAAVGALLQIRLASALREEAISYAPQLPPDLRTALREAFARAAAGGLDLRGAAGGPPGRVTSEAAAVLQRVAREVFTHAFVDAMRVTLLIPVCVLLLAAGTCLAIRRTRAGDRPGELEPADRPLAQTNAGRLRSE